MFCPFSLPMDPENQNFEKMEKNTWRYYHFTLCVPQIIIISCTVPEVWCTTDRRMDGRTDGQADGQKKWHIEVGPQGIIQKKSASGTRMLPWLVIFFRNFILIWKCQKGSLNRGTLVSANAIYQTKCPFSSLSALFLFFQMLPYDSKLFPGAPPKKSTND